MISDILKNASKKAQEVEKENSMLALVGIAIATTNPVDIENITCLMARYLKLESNLAQKNPDFESVFDQKNLEEFLEELEEKIDHLIVHHGQIEKMIDARRQNPIKEKDTK